MSWSGRTEGGDGLDMQTFRKRASELPGVMRQLRLRFEDSKARFQVAEGGDLGPDSWCEHIKEGGRQAGLWEQGWRQLAGFGGLLAEQTPSAYSIHHLTAQAFLVFGAETA